MKNNSKKKVVAKARFDARLTEEQKGLFEEAAKIKGYSSLSNFVIQVCQEASVEIINRHNAILISEKDKSIFFDALANPPKPNKALVQAAKLYKKQVSKK